MSNCALLWKTVLVQNSPDHSSTVVVKKLCAGPDCGLRVFLEENRAETLLFRDQRDRVPQSAAVAWSPDSARLSVLVCDPLAGNVLIGFDRQTRSFLSIEAAKKMVADSVRARYLSRSADDPVKWFCSIEGVRTLRANHP